MRKGNGSKLWQRCQLQSSFMAKEFSDKMKSLFQWQKVMKWHEQPFEFSLRDFDPNRPTRYILCTLHDRCAVVSWEGLRDRWLKKAHFQTSWNSEKIWTLSNILSRFFFFYFFFLPQVQVNYVLTCMSCCFTGISVVRPCARSQSASEYAGNNTSHGIVHAEYVHCNQKVSCFSECMV